MRRNHRETTTDRRPFWLPAPNYYAFAAAMSIASFFLIWGILHDGLEETPGITAGIGAGLVLCCAVFLREFILRNARNRFLINKKRLDKSVRTLSGKVRDHQSSGKLTLERNAVLLQELSRKSDAAKELGRFSEGHKAVFDLCEEYLTAAAEELPSVGTGSPRLAALHKGRKIVTGYHRFHLLRWAEIEARSLIQEAKSRASISEKLDITQKAIGIVSFALRFYPKEKALLESEEVLQDIVASIKVSNWIEKAERAFFQGDHEEAVGFYKAALSDLEIKNAANSDRAKRALKIKDEIERIEQILAKG